jgi:hypothetical protein
MGDKSHADFRRAVWHSSFKVLLESISIHSRTGCWVRCGDGINRLLYPVILILAADYEEQCVF